MKTWYNDTTTHFRITRESEPMNPTHECNVLEWLANCDFEVIDDSQVEIFRCAEIDVLHGDNWIVRAHTDTRARLIRYEMSFSINTPANLVIEAIKLASGECFKCRTGLDQYGNK